MELTQDQKDLLAKFNLVRYEDAEYPVSSDSTQFILGVLATLTQQQDQFLPLIHTGGSFLINDAQSGELRVCVEIIAPDREHSLVIHTAITVGIDIASKTLTNADFSNASISLNHKSNTTELEDELDVYLEEEFEISDNGQAIANVFFNDESWKSKLNKLIFSI